jgi:hypothetical protein
MLGMCWRVRSGPRLSRTSKCLLLSEEAKEVSLQYLLYIMIIKITFIDKICRRQMIMIFIKYSLLFKMSLIS